MEGNMAKGWVIFSNILLKELYLIIWISFPSTNRYENIRFLTSLSSQNFQQSLSPSNYFLYHIPSLAHELFTYLLHYLTSTMVSAFIKSNNPTESPRHIKPFTYSRKKIKENNPNFQNFFKWSYLGFKKKTFSSF